MLMQLVTLLPLSELDHATSGEYLTIFNSSIFYGPDVLTSSKYKANLFAGKFSANSTLDDMLHSLPDFSL